MNILIILQHLYVGGAQSFALRLANALNKDHKVFIYDLNPELMQKDFVDSLLSSDIPILSPRYLKVLTTLTKPISDIVRPYIKISLYHLIRYRISGWHFKKTLRKKRIEIVNSHIFEADKFATHFSSVPVVISMHGCYESLMYGGYNQTGKGKSINKQFVSIAKGIIAKASNIIISAEKNREIFKVAGLNGTNVKKIYYGYAPKNSEVEQNSNIVKDRVVITMVARGIEEKGWKIAVRACELLINQGYKLKLVFVCDETEEIEQILTENYNFLHYTGFTSNPLSYIKVSDVCILPTYFPGESLPNSVIEYLYCGKPVVATDIGEIQHMLSHNNELAGYLLKMSNGQPAVSELADVLKTYLDNGDLLLKHALIAREAFKKFDLMKCKLSYEHIFKMAV